MLRAHVVSSVVPVLRRATASPHSELTVKPQRMRQLHPVVEVARIRHPAPGFTKAS